MRLQLNTLSHTHRHNLLNIYLKNKKSELTLLYIQNILNKIILIFHRIYKIPLKIYQNFMEFMEQLYSDLNFESFVLACVFTIDNILA